MGRGRGLRGGMDMRRGGWLLVRGRVEVGVESAVERGVGWEVGLEVQKERREGEG